MRETEHTPIAKLIEQIEPELNLQQSSILSSDTPVQSPRGKQEGPSIGGSLNSPRLFGRFKKKKNEKSELNDSKDSSGSASPNPGNKAGMIDIKEFGLYWSEKEEWLDENREITSYFFPDNVQLEYKRRLRDFKLRVKYEIKLLFTELAQSKVLTVSPHTTTIFDIRKSILSWVKDDFSLYQLLLQQNSQSTSPQSPSAPLSPSSQSNVSASTPQSNPSASQLQQQQQLLLLYGLFLNGKWLEEEDKLLTFYHIKQKDTLEIKLIPHFYLHISSSSDYFTASHSFYVTLLPNCTFDFLLSQLFDVCKKNEEFYNNFKQFLSIEWFQVQLNNPMKVINNLKDKLSGYLIKKDSFIDILLRSAPTTIPNTPTSPPSARKANILTSSNQPTPSSPLLLHTSVVAADLNAKLIWKVHVLRVPNDTYAITDSGIPAQYQLDGEKLLSNIMDHVTIFISNLTNQTKGAPKNQTQTLAQPKFHGTLMITNFRILLERKFQGKESDENIIEIPLLSISSLLKIKSKDKELRKHCLDILCKNIRIVKLGFVDSLQRNYCLQLLNDLLNDHSPSNLFAYSHGSSTMLPSSTPVDVQAGWDVYDAKSEYARLGILGYSKERFGWRLTNLNQNYSLSKTYPNLIVVPATLSDEVIAAAASYRTKSRFPALCWIHPETGATLCRSSQPKVGLQRNISKEDQIFLQEIANQGCIQDFNSSKKKKKLQKEKKLEKVLHIFDARPLKAAMGNTVMGAGYEGMTAGYSFCNLHFLNIGIFSSFSLLPPPLLPLSPSLFPSSPLSPLSSSLLPPLLLIPSLLLSPFSFPSFLAPFSSNLPVLLWITFSPAFFFFSPLPFSFPFFFVNLFLHSAPP